MSGPFVDPEPETDDAGDVGERRHVGGTSGAGGGAKFPWDSAVDAGAETEGDLGDDTAHQESAAEPPVSEDAVTSVR